MPPLCVRAFLSKGDGQENARAQQIAQTCDRIGLRRVVTHRAVKNALLVFAFPSPLVVMGACQSESERIETAATEPRLGLGLRRQLHQAPFTAGQGSLALDAPGRDRLDNFSAAHQDEIEAPPTSLSLPIKAGSSASMKTLQAVKVFIVAESGTAHWEDQIVVWIAVQGCECFGLEQCRRKLSSVNGLHGE